jgi:hypothetical protein
MTFSGEWLLGPGLDLSLGRLISFTYSLGFTIPLRSIFPLLFWTSLLRLQEEDFSVIIITPMF